MRNLKLSFLVAVALLCSLAGRSATAALVTFSGLHNGINTATDPENFATGTAVPTNYQPLLNAYPAPGGNVDGANIGVTINWANAQVAAQPFAGVFDHTAMVTPSDNAEVLAYLATGSAFDVTFDKSVNIPSFYYANYNGGGPFTIEFKGFTNVGDATPAIDITHTYTQSSGPNSGGYQWIQELGLGFTSIKELQITGSQYLQTDDFTIINAVPEPSSVVLFGLGAAGLVLATRHRRKA